MANKTHVELLLRSVEEWNDWREKNPKEIPDLRGAILCDGELSKADLHKADLHKADLSEANLVDADLIGADLSGADLLGVYLDGADIVGGNLIGADITNAYLSGADLRGADLRGANLSGTILSETILEEANLQDAKLLGVRCLRLSGTYVKGARFGARAKDPWSVLRRTYSGPRLAFNLLFLVAFMIPYVVKVLFWVAVNRAQTLTEAALAEPTRLLALNPETTTNYARCLHDVCVPQLVWEVILGVDRGWPFWTLAVALITYNILKAGLTWRIAPMRDEEERSGYSPDWIRENGISGEGEIRLFPSWMPSYFGDRVPARIWGWISRWTGWLQGYKPMFLAHQYFVRWVLWIAIFAFAYNAYDWLLRTVWIPG